MKPTSRRDGLLRDFLVAQLQWERARALRFLFVNLVAFVGMLCLVPLAWPDRIPAELTRVCIRLWGACAVGVVVAAWSEWRWRRERERRLMVLESKDQIP